MNAKSILLALASAASLAVVSSCASSDPVTQVNASNASASAISSESRAALRSLYAQNAAARALGKRARGVLVFPTIVKGGLIVGAQGGNGAMIRNGNVTGYYQTVSASYGLQAGVQKFGYALFFMNDRAFRELDQSRGWELGGSPNVVIVDQGMAATLSTTTAGRDVYAFFFNQRGLMGGLTLEGTKVTRIHPQQ